MTSKTKKNLLKKITKALLCSMFALSAITATSEASELTAFQSAQALKTKYNVVNSLGVSNKLGNAMENLDYSNVLWMEATGYSRFDPGCGDYTATGEFLHYGIAAVDTDVISLGTSMFVEGYGHAIAADTGGAIVGNRIDLAFESREDAFNWGRRGVNVYIK